MARRCARCGDTGHRFFASIGEKDYCHEDSHSCYSKQLLDDAKMDVGNFLAWVGFPQGHDRSHAHHRITMTGGLLGCTCGWRPPPHLVAAVDQHLARLHDERDE